MTLGFEHFWNEHWSGGATLRYVSASKAYDVVPELLLRHRSALGPLTFGQRLSVERTFPSPTGAISQNYARLRADLEKAVPVGRFALRPRLSYQADVHVRILRTDADPTERTVQFTSLRGEIGCRLSPVVDFTPWFAYQTSYILTIEQTNGMGMVVVPAGRFNLVTPVVGLDVRFTLLQGQDGTARQQLPTQH